MLWTIWGHIFKYSYYDIDEFRLNHARVSFCYSVSIFLSLYQIFMILKLLFVSEVEELWNWHAAVFNDFHRMPPIKLENYNGITEIKNSTKKKWYDGIMLVSNRFFNHNFFFDWRGSIANSEHTWWPWFGFENFTILIGDIQLLWDISRNFCYKYSNTN